MHARTMWCAAILSALASQAVWADTQSFTVNAQYRGMVKKAFTDIGTGELTDSKTGGGFKISGRADVDHPREEGKRYQLSIDMAFRQRGNVIEEVANNSRCNPGSEEALKTTTKILPFVHVIKWLQDDKSTGQSFNTPRGTFRLNLAQTDRNLEATLYEGDRMVGKFFMEPDNNRLPRKLEKFRITTRTGTVLSFVSTPNVAAR